MWLSVFIGGALGSLARYVVGLYLNHSSWPFGTWLVNILGSFLIGFLFVIGKEKTSISPEMYLFLTTGFMGGFTTFSTFSLEVIQMLLDGKITTAIIYALLSVVLGILFAFAGIWLARQLVI